MRITILAAILLCTVSKAVYAQGTEYDLPIAVGVFGQQVHRAYTMEKGLPDNNVHEIYLDPQGHIVALTAKGAAFFDGSRWQPGLTSEPVPESRTKLDKRQSADLCKLAGSDITIRVVAEYQGELAVAADRGLFLWKRRNWRMALPCQGEVRWAPLDVRAVAFDVSGTLWFAAPQGAGYRISDENWKLFTGASGLPYNDFTCIAAGRESVWFGTTNGAIQYRDGSWSFRHGRRWLLDNYVRDIVIDREGNAWIATPGGVSCIASQPMTLGSKAAFFEEEIEKYHRRTRFGYVNPAKLAVAGDKSSGVPAFTDNDGQRMGLYLSAVSLGYAATGRPKLKQDAVNAFRALAFLSEVTHGGTHPAPEGFIARAVIPASDPDPNPDYDLAYDIRRRERDALWKIIQPRLPRDESGEWYWKNDGSADELDGHFLGYATYFDRVCETEDEKNEVRKVVRRITDHIIEHGYNLVDYDGQPTRWGRLSPDDLNRNEEWVVERGLRSFSILAYLSVAHHITGDPKYREEYLKLALDHGYGMNGMTQPRDITGPGTFGQGDDKMAFMNYYHLIRYETDPKLLSMYYHAINRHWLVEKYEQCPLTNFIYAACCSRKIRRDHWGEMDLTPPKDSFEDAINTLKLYPVDLINWPMSNAHRIDMIPLQGHLGQVPGTAGHRVDGTVFPIDERNDIRWGRDPYVLTYNGDGTQLEEGVQYLLAFYMGLAHGFIGE